MFHELQIVMQQHLTLLLTLSRQRLFMTDVDREALWEAYINGFPEELRQEHNCNACKSFIRHYGGIVAIMNGETVGVWDFVTVPGSMYHASRQAMSDLVINATINDVFIPTERRLGIDKNKEMGADGVVISWEHFHWHMTGMQVHTSRTESVDTVRSNMRGAQQVFKRGMEELKMEAIDTVLELIAQNSLYRGAESKNTLLSFRALKEAYDRQPNDRKIIWTWENSSNAGHAVTAIRNSAMGTLLIDLSGGMELDQAVSRFEAIMAPTNYKRPTAVLTNRMIEEAEKKIVELGYGSSLGRRFATVDDITVNNTLYVDRSLKSLKGDVLASLKEAPIVNVKALSKVEEMSITTFVQNILSKAETVELMFESRHMPNLMSLIAPADAQAPSMFKWGNNFSWSYKDAVADSIKERVKAAGGSATGDVRISLSWFNHDDLDLHLQEPTGGTHIYFSNKGQKSIGGGMLDVDMNAGSGQTRQAVENIVYQLKRTMLNGVHKVSVNQYHKRETVDVGFDVEVEIEGEVYSFSYPSAVGDKQYVHVCDLVNDRKTGIIKVEEKLPSTSRLQSKKVWGIDTNKFHRVSMITTSPNYWDNRAGVGNQHLFFIIDQAHNDEKARGFFNEFLNPVLEPYKRVFEALGSKMAVAPADKQVTGLGFSYTQHSDLYVRVTGQFTRTLKIKF